MNELEKASNAGKALSEAVDEGRVKMSAILDSLGIKVGDPAHQAALLVCEKYDLDPLRKEVIVIPGKGVFVTRDGHLRVAHRHRMVDGTPTLDGIVVEEEGESDREWWCRVSVHRKDMKYPFTYLGVYSKGGRNKEHGRKMAIANGERIALSRAFPVEGLPSMDDSIEVTARELRADALTAELAELGQAPIDRPADPIDVGEITHEAIDDGEELFTA